MTDVWQGEITLPNGDSIKDIGFSAQNVALSPPALTAAHSLRFLSTVDPARIPLCLAAGPSYDVWTSSEASEAWFESVLLSRPALADGNGNGTREWWTLARAQSPIGVLVEVEVDGGQADGSTKPRITQVLFYGTVAAAKPAAEGSGSGSGSGSLPELRVHALPLSSDLLYQSVGAASAVVPPSPTTETSAPSTEFEAHYLPPAHEPSTTPKSPKRKRDLFEEATLARRKAKGRGGEGVAVAAHHGESQRPYAHRKSISTDANAPQGPLPDSRPPSAHGALSRPASRQLSRSPSITSDTRPLSRRDTAEIQQHGRRSHLSRVDTISSPQPEEPTTESRNKEALTKVVLAAMRMHGLQQRRKGKQRAPALDDSQTATATADQPTAEDAAKDEEYKHIYHQTYRGAALALRNHMATAALHAQPDTLRDLVERFLALFLRDPLAPRAPSADADPAPPPAATRAALAPSLPAGVFDLPSGRRRPPIARAQTDGLVYTGSPVGKKKGGERTTDGGRQKEKTVTEA